MRKTLVVTFSLAFLSGGEEDPESRVRRLPDSYPWSQETRGSLDPCSVRFGCGPFFSLILPDPRLPTPYPGRVSIVPVHMLQRDRRLSEIFFFPVSYLGRVICGCEVEGKAVTRTG